MNDDSMNPADPGAPPPSETPPQPQAPPQGQAPPPSQAPPAADRGWQDHRGRRHDHVTSHFNPRHKSPALTSVLSLVPGLGQIYLGYYLRGFAHLGVVATTIAFLGAGNIPDFMYPLLGIFLPFFWLYNIVDAGRRAAYYNMVMEGSDPEGLQPEFDMPQRGGSMIWGLALIIGGLFLLIHIQFGFSLEWLETWWPIIPVFIGIYLFMKGLRERSESA
ncbi:MAG: hypothetical protein O7F11_00910 [Acidobacteria bacterium]|nr:hypothetical protein [Acidobacteriota bacterium]